MFYRVKLDGFAVHMPYAMTIERIRHTNITARIPKKCFLSAVSMLANMKLKKNVWEFFL